METKRAIFALLSAPAFLGGTACMEYEVGGKTVTEVFSDPALAQIAAAACEGRTGEVRRLAQEGVDVNGAGYEGTTPLLWALARENVGGMEALLEAGADPNQRAGFLTPVTAAATYENPELLALLLRHGGDPDAVEEGGRWTALRRAFSLGARSQRWENYYRLLDAGADINKPNGLGDGIGQLAVALGQFDKAVELLGRGYAYDLETMVRYAQIHNTDPKFSHEKEKLFRALEEKGFFREKSKDRPADPTVA